MKRSSRVDWIKAPDVQIRLNHIISSSNFEWIKRSKIHCFRSENSKSRAYARIWGLSKVWQLALSSEPAYIIEVLSEKYDKLSEKEKDRILLHELAHIPKNFSGSLLPHVRKRGKRNFEDRVKQLVTLYEKKK